MTRLAFPNRRPRCQCPQCGRSVATSAVSGAQGRLLLHRFLGEDCPGSHQWAPLNGRTEVEVA